MAENNLSIEDELAEVFDGEESKGSKSVKRTEKAIAGANLLMAELKALSKSSKEEVIEKKPRKPRGKKEKTGEVEEPPEKRMRKSRAKKDKGEDEEEEEEEEEDEKPSCKKSRKSSAENALIMALLQKVDKLSEDIKTNRHAQQRAPLVVPNNSNWKTTPQQLRNLHAVGTAQSGQTTYVLRSKCC